MFGYIAKGGDVMAMRRMFSLQVIDTDRFIEMPVSARLLYYELGMRADDDGFVSSPVRIIRSVGCSSDDLKLLIAKGYVISFDSGIVAIRHWKMHNYIPADRYKKTIYQEEAQSLRLTDNVYDLDTDCIQTVYIGKDRSGKDRIGEDRSGEVNIGKDNIGEDNTGEDRSGEVNIGKDNTGEDNTGEGRSENSVSAHADAPTSFDYQSVIDRFNSVCVSLPKVLKLTDKRKQAIRSAAALLEGRTFEELFGIVERSDFLTGRGSAWSCGFDWIIKPENLTKILEGTYDNTRSRPAARGGMFSMEGASFDLAALEESLFDD